MLGSTHRIGGIAIGALIPVVIQNSFEIQIDNPLLFVSLTMSGGALGSLIPDIDSTTSTLGRRIKGVSKFFSSKFGHRGGTHTILSCILFSFLCIFLTNELEIYLSTNINNEKIFMFSAINALVVVTSCLFILGSIPNKYRGPLSKKNDIYIIIFLTLATMFFTFKNIDAAISYIEIYMIGISFGYVSHIILDLFTKEGVPLFRPLIKYRFKLLPFKTGSFIEGIVRFFNLIVIIYALFTLLN